MLCVLVSVGPLFCSPFSLHFCSPFSLHFCRSWRCHYIHKQEIVINTYHCTGYYYLWQRWWGFVWISCYECAFQILLLQSLLLFPTQTLWFSCWLCFSFRACLGMHVFFFSEVYSPSFTTYIHVICIQVEHVLCAFPFGDGINLQWI